MATRPSRHRSGSGSVSILIFDPRESVPRELKRLPKVPSNIPSTTQTRWIPHKDKLLLVSRPIVPTGNSHCASTGRHSNCRRLQQRFDSAYARASTRERKRTFGVRRPAKDSGMGSGLHVPTTGEAHEPLAGQVGIVLSLVTRYLEPKAPRMSTWRAVRAPSPSTEQVSPVAAGWDSRFGV